LVFFESALFICLLAACRKTRSQQAISSFYKPFETFCKKSISTHLKDVQAISTVRSAASFEMAC